MSISETERKMLKARFKNIKVIYVDGVIKEGYCDSYESSLDNDDGLAEITLVTTDYENLAISENEIMDIETLN